MRIGFALLVVRRSHEPGAVLTDDESEDGRRPEPRQQPIRQPREALGVGERIEGVGHVADDLVATDGRFNSRRRGDGKSSVTSTTTIVRLRSRGAGWLEPIGILLTAISIRSATGADIPAITEIYRTAVLHGTASFEIEPPDDAEMLARMGKILDGRYPYVVAEAAGRVAGYAYAGPYRPRPAYRHTVEDSIYVAHEAQGTGVGRALLAALVAECERLGFRRMVAVIGDSKSLGSIRLHASCGFTHAGLLPSVGWKHGRWLDQVLMQRSLGPGDQAPPTS
jgi:L-amino acid N-acyltransferase YncA